MAQKANISSSAQSRFEPEGFPLPNRIVNFLEEQASGFDSACARIEWRKTAGNFIRVEEAKAVDFIREEFFREGRLACAIAAGDEVNYGTAGRHVMTECS